MTDVNQFGSYTRAMPACLENTGPSILLVVCQAYWWGLAHSWQSNFGLYGFAEVEAERSLCDTAFVSQI